MSEQVDAFVNLWLHVNEKGVYIIEDIFHENIDKYKTLEVFTKEFIENVINKYFDVEYYDTREIANNSNDFIVCFVKKNTC